MKNLIKKLSLILVIALTCCLGIFAAACGGDNGTTEPEKGTYTVTVLMPDGSALDGTKEEFSKTIIQICLPGENGACSLVQGKLNNEGKYSFTKEETKLDGDTFVLHILRLPEAYTYDEVTVSPSSPTATINLKAA